uniref:Moesin/ezrin/radixin homolog 1 n=1 Tax=Romanomermis culicivorax TaxID=13658 RepID=A0A915KE58_ROMCU
MLRFGSGSYNVRESEIVRHERRDTSFRTIICTYRTIGQELLDKVFRHLELIEKDYFALQYDDLLSKNDCLCWLDPTQSIRKQLRCPPYVLYLRVKFYVSDPCKLHEEYTRYHFYLQLRKNIAQGKLFCTESSSALLGSYAVHCIYILAEYGDYVDEEHGESYLDGFQFAPNQTTSLVRKIADLHKLHRGQTPADAEYNFLDHAKRLDTYGVNLCQAQDSNFCDVFLGAACYGLAVFQKTQRTHAYCWSKILEISFKRKQFFLKLIATSTSE